MKAPSTPKTAKSPLPARQTIGGAHAVTRPIGRFALDGRVAVVTGGLGKLGPVWLEALLDAGASVAALDIPAATVPEPVRALEDRFKKKVKVVRGDIRDRQDLEEARRTIGGAYGRPVGIVVNNAGIDQPPGVVKKSFEFEDLPIEAVRQTLDVNFTGAFQVLQAFGKDLQASGHGSVINIGSLYAMVSPDQRLYEHLPVEPPFLKPAAYGASKAALVNLTKYLAALWGPKGVRVNALSPGGVEGGQDAEFKRKFTGRVPMGRMARVEDLGGPLVFLASDASSYVTGTNLIVDGGFTAW